MLWVLICIISTSIHNICLYKEEDKKYIGCNLKITELLDYALIGVTLLVVPKAIQNKVVLYCILLV